MALSNLIFLFTIVTCVAVLAVKGQAERLPREDVRGPGLLPPRQSNEEIKKCWSRILSVDGCTTQVYDSHTKNQFTGLSPACCATLTSIPEICWKRVFPFNPRFPRWLKGHCAKPSGKTLTPRHRHGLAPDLRYCDDWKNTVDIAPCSYRGGTSADSHRGEATPPRQPSITAAATASIALDL
ncbi:hypothetical protein RJ640_012435, partial [Escallonia rubra]